MEGGHGGLMVRKGPIAGNIYGAAERWSGRHEALSNLIGVFVCFLSPRSQFFIRFFLNSLDRLQHYMPCI